MHLESKQSISWTVIFVMFFSFFSPITVVLAEDFSNYGTAKLYENGFKDEEPLFEPAVGIEPTPVTAGEIAPGEILADLSGKWEYREEANYTTNNMESVINQAHYLWVKTHQTEVSSTFMSAYPIGLYNFDQSNGNSWAGSGSGTANTGIRKFLNGSSYSGTDSDTYETTFYDTLSAEFRDYILPRELEGETDSIYLPSRANLDSTYGADTWDFFMDGYPHLLESLDPHYYSEYMAGYSELQEGVWWETTIMRP